MEKIKNKLKITFLGTGSNGGIPQLDCRCENCSSGEIRRRSSILIEYANKKYIIDCGPDFKQQLVDQNLRLQEIDGIILTHLHWDHSIGLFELTSGQKLNIPIFAGKKVIKSLTEEKQFKYIFEAGFAQIGNKIKGIDLSFLEVAHDNLFFTYAVKISACPDKTILYAPDISKILDEFKNASNESDLIILDGTFINSSISSHVSIRESINELKGDLNKIIFTHINHSEDISKINSLLSDTGAKLAEDRLSLVI